MTPTETFRNLPEAKRLRVLQAAGREFAEQGFAGASMNRLAAGLGIAKGSLFKYFGSKEGCFRAVFDQGVTEFARRMRAARATGPAHESFLPRLERLVRAALLFVAENPDIYRIYLKMRVQEDFPLRAAVLHEVRANVHRLLAPQLIAARDRGELRPDLDVHTAVFVLDAVLDRFLQEQAFPPGAGTDPEEEFQKLITLVRHGLGAEEQS